MSLNVFEQIASSSTEFWAVGLADAALKSLLILVVVQLAIMMTRRASASTRHFIWVLGVLGCLVIPVLTLALPKWQVFSIRQIGFRQDVQADAHRGNSAKEAQASSMPMTIRAGDQSRESQVDRSSRRLVAPAVAVTVVDSPTQLPRLP